MHMFEKLFIAANSSWFSHQPCHTLL